MSVVGGAVGGTLAGLMIANNVGRLTRGLKDAEASWSTLAERGLRLERVPAKGVLEKAGGPTRPELRGSIQGCGITVRVVSDLVHYAHTEVVATPPAGGELPGVTVGVHPNPRGMLGRVRAWLGQDIEVGDAAFDEAFLITGEPISAPVRLLRGSLREKLTGLGAGPLTGFVYDGDQATVLLDGVVTDAKILDAAIDAASEAACGGWAS